MKSILAWVFVVLFMVGTVLQPLLPPSLAPLLIATRLVVLPAMFVALFFGLVETVALASFGLAIFASSLVNGARLDVVFWQIFLSVVAIPACIVGGAMLASKRWAKSVWLALLFASLGLNLLTAAIYGDALRGGDIAEEILFRAQREAEDPLFRFALGNAIEVPALLCAATVVAAIVLGVGTPWVALGLAANLLSAAISQSRLVLLLAASTLIRFLPRLHLLATFAAGSLLLLVAFSQVDAILENADSIRRRFLGDDAGSALDRLMIVGIVYEACDWRCLAFGDGLGSSLAAMQHAGQGYRTVESGLLQLLYEVGVGGLLLLMLTVWLPLRGKHIRIRITIEGILIFSQAMLLLPVFTFTPLYLFLAGVLCASGTPQSSVRRAPLTPDLPPRGN